MPKKMLCGKLSFRIEDNFYQSYYVIDDMQIHIGSVNMDFLHRHPETKETFISFAKTCVELLLSDSINEVKSVSWDAPTAAPEHEKSGRA